MANDVQLPLPTTGSGLSTFKNEITGFDSPVTNETKRWEVGRSMYDYFIYHYAGVDEQNGDALYFMYEDDKASGQRIPVLDDNGIHKTTTNYQDAGKAFTGDRSNHDLIGSFQNSFKYKGFGANFLVTFAFGGKNLDYGYSNLMNSTSYGKALHIDANDAWRNAGDITNIPRLEIGAPNQNVSNSSRFLIDASYLTLRNVSFSYDLEDKGLKNKLGINKLSLFISGENLLIRTKRKGLNPQENLTGLRSGKNFNPTKIFSLGVNLAF